MRRSFDEHIRRKTVCLDGTWHFIIDPEDEGEALGYTIALPETAMRVEVPSCWNNELDLLEYEGAAWYQKRIYCHGGYIRFEFGAVMTAADVWIDGEKLVSHYGGFSAFEALKLLEEGYHILTVRADNRFDADAIPHAKVDWYHYGGIVRGVTMEYLDGICVLSCHMDYTLSDDRTEAEAIIRARVFNASTKSTNAPMRVLLNDAQILEMELSLESEEETTVESEIIYIKNLRLWDIEDPYLYTLLAQTPTDDLYDRVGLRTIAVKDGAVCLNGRAIEIRGVCRHEDHPEFGFAFPPRLMKRDIDLLRSMACNSIRGSHYPNSKLFVDLLDEEGILFWSEIPIWGCGFSEADLANHKIVSRGLNMIREMEAQYFNHPSIIIWGMHNEIESGTQAAYDMTRLYHDELRAKGGNRLVTHASNKPLADICYEFDDIICINHYSGWYGDGIKSWDDAVEAHIKRRNELGFQDKPIIYSEFGGAALYGHHTFDNIKWTEEYQAEIFRHCLPLFHKTPEIVGWYVWQFFDTRTCSEMTIARARGFNNKGILNEYRKPKLSYYAIKENCVKFQNEE